MAKIKSLEELKALRDSVQNKVDVREHGDKIEEMIVVRVAMATCGIAAGARQIMNHMANELREQGIDNVMITQVGCMGYCYAEPTVEVTLQGQDPVVYGNVTTEKATEIIEKYIKNGIMLDGIIPSTHRALDE
mgnify:CR=1 FL=1